MHHNQLVGVFESSRSRFAKLLLHSRRQQKFFTLNGGSIKLTFPSNIQ